MTKAPRKSTYYEDSSYYTDTGSSNKLLGCATILLAFVTVIIPLIGIIVGGIVAFNQDDTKKMIGIGLVIFALLVIFVQLIIF